MGIEAGIRKGIMTGLGVFSHVERMIRTGISLCLIVCNKRHIISQKVTDGTLYILGNGPSLIKQIETYGDFLVTKDLICMNAMSTTQYYEYLRPQYYIYVDPDGFVPLDELCPESRLEVVNTFKEIVEKTKWPMVLFVPSVAEKNEEWVKYIQSNPCIKIEYLNSWHYIGYEALKYRLIKKQYICFPFMNVLIGAINAGIASGYKHIYLLGADHSWVSSVIVDDENLIRQCTAHFYDTNPGPSKVDLSDGTRRGYADYLKGCVSLFYEYRDIAKYTKKEGIEIFNATQGSFIDAFERRYVLAQ